MNAMNAMNLLPSLSMFPHEGHDHGLHHAMPVLIGAGLIVLAIVAIMIAARLPQDGDK